MDSDTDSDIYHPSEVDTFRIADCIRTIYDLMIMKSDTTCRHFSWKSNLETAGRQVKQDLSHEKDDILQKIERKIIDMVDTTFD